ncbi:MAG TPA: hypothetical protein VIQ24_04935 [Pyrinomonadaceae bacterium]
MQKLSDHTKDIEAAAGSVGQLIAAKISFATLPDKVQKALGVTDTVVAGTS